MLLFNVLQNDPRSFIKGFQKFLKNCNFVKFLMYCTGRIRIRVSNILESDPDPNYSNRILNASFESSNMYMSRAGRT